MIQLKKTLSNKKENKLFLKYMRTSIILRPLVRDMRNWKMFDNLQEKEKLTVMQLITSTFLPTIYSVTCEYALVQQSTSALLPTMPCFTCFMFSSAFRSWSRLVSLSIKSLSFAVNSAIKENTYTDADMYIYILLFSTINHLRSMTQDLVRHTVRWIYCSTLITWSTLMLCLLI